MRAFGVLLLLSTVVVGFLSCVSRSLTEERFSESETLSAPTNTVVLADPTNFSFSFVGDMHIAGGDVSRLSQILDGTSADGDAFHISLGDIVDEGEEGDFIAFTDTVNAKGWNGKLFPAIGNHDVFYEGWQFFKQYLGRSHYTVTLGNSKFIVFDTADGTVGEEQIAWIDRELSAANPENVFLVSHYLPVIPGVQTYLRLANRDEAVALMRIASEKNVTAWIGAHYHSYISEVINGVRYVVAGGGGGRRMGPVREYFYVRATVSGSDVSFERKTIE